MKRFKFLALTAVLALALVFPGFADTDLGYAELYVHDMTNQWTYYSADGGATWRNNAVPPVYVTLPGGNIPDSEDSSEFRVVNNTKQDTWTGTHYGIRKWDGQSWQRIKEYDELVFTEEALGVAAGGSCDLWMHWNNANMGLDMAPGKYKLVRNENANGNRYICEAVFTLV